MHETDDVCTGDCLIIFSLDNFCVCAKEKFDERRWVAGIMHFIFGSATFTY